MAKFEAIPAELRTRAGKGAARATRREGRVPAVIYGAKQEPTLISLDPRFVIKELNRGGWRSRLYEIETSEGKARALMRDVQFHPVTDLPEHVDFQRLGADATVRVAVQVSFINEGISVGLKRGGVLNIVRHTVEVTCNPDTIPDHFEADLGPLDINDNVRWSDLKHTAGAKPTITDRDFVVATVAAPTVMPDTGEAEVQEAAPAAAAAPAPAKR